MSLEEFQPGFTFSHYRLTSKLGTGGMGIVYIAEDTTLRRQVAIKFLNSDKNNRLARSRFLREARLASLLNHPNIATVYDYGETDAGRPYIVMELLRGQTLSELLAAGALSLERSIGIIKSVLSALVEAHRHGIVHRDIKPSNICLNELGQVKVLDFGLAKVIWESDHSASALAGVAEMTTQTRSGMVLGTPLYVSPEQATGTEVNQCSDIFSLGAVLYECLAGRPAFAAPSVVEIFAQVISSTAPPPPSKYNQAIPAKLDRITLKALARNTEDRYQTAGEFLADLDGLSIEPSKAEVVPTPALGDGLGALYGRIVSRTYEPRHSFQVKQDDRLQTREITLPVRRLMWIVCSLIFAFALVFFGLKYFGRGAPIDSLAVLPFINESHDESIEYLSDGLTDSLISSFSRLSGIKVISRSSISRYRAGEVDPLKVGTDLKAGAMLVGRVKKDANELLHISVELIDTHDGSQLWSERYSRKASDVLSIEADITAQVAEKMRQNLSPEKMSSLTQRFPHNPAAYDLYLKGRWYWNKLTADTATKAIQCFQQAIDLEHNFALAYAGLADTYVLMSWVPPGESYRRAKAAAEKALELDPTLAEAHTTLAFIKTHYERDWAGAEVEFKRALELNPRYATAHHWYSDYLLATGQTERALLELKLAQELDPLSPAINTDIGAYYFQVRDYDRAIEELKKVKILFPDFFSTNCHLGMAYTFKGQYEQAIEEYEKALTLSGRHTLVLAMLGYTYGVAGRETEARQILNELLSTAQRKNVSPYRFALVYTGMGDKEMAFAWLNRALDENDIMSIYIKVSPYSDTLRQEQRFTELVQRMGLNRE